ncbi:MAG: chromate transporter [Peptoniphilaceae bacterium]|nr:chromate transporter [Peptoniphilaceae bacterium]
MLPIIEEELVSKRKWLKKDEILDFYAIGQVTPGIIAINTSTFCGYYKKGIAGAIISTLGFITPSIFIITIISKFISKFLEYSFVQNAFSGIRIVVCVLVIKTVFNIVKENASKKITFFVFLFSFILVAVFAISPVIIVIGISVFAYLLGRKNDISNL